MRKELRVGLGIGGVLLSVLIVALIVRSRTPETHKVSRHVADTTKIDGTSSTATDAAPVTTVTPPSDPPAANLPADTTPTPKPGSDTPDPFGKEASANGGSTTGGEAAAGKGSVWDNLFASSNTTSTPSSMGRGPTPGGDALPPLTGADSTRTASRTDGSHVTAGATQTNSGDSIERLAPPAPTSSKPRGAKPAAAPGAHSRVVAQGETFSSIARAAYGSAKYADQIVEANKNVSPTRLRPGMTIMLPDIPAAAATERTTPGAGPARTSTSHRGGAVGTDPRREYVVQPGDSLFRISNRLYGSGEQVDAIYSANRAAIGPDRARLKLGMVLQLPEAPTSASAR